MDTNFMGRKELILIGSAVVLLILVGIGASLNKGPSSETAAPGANETASSTGANAASSTPTSTAQKPSAPALSYTQAVNLYAGRRIQFDVNCVMTPNGLVVRNGTNVMLDNRSPNARPVYLDRREYFIGGYGYRIVPFSYRTLPHTVAVDCGTGRGTGTVLVQ